VHKRKPDYLNPKATYHFEDIRKENVLAKHLRDADVVVHLAAMVVAGREALGASKNELFADFRQVPPGDLTDEIDNLVRLDALTLDDPGVLEDVREVGGAPGDGPVSSDAPREADRREP